MNAEIIDIIIADEDVRILNPPDIFGQGIAMLVPEKVVPTDLDIIEEASIRICAIDFEVQRANSVLNTLASLFRVIKTGDELDRKYTISFNSKGECQIDEHSERILSEFIEAHSLDLSCLTTRVGELQNLLIARLERGKPDYCEVDIFNKEKEPVEC